MSSLASSLSNLLESLLDILKGILNTLLAAFESAFTLAQNLLSSLLALAENLISSIFNLMSGFIEFVHGRPFPSLSPFRFTSFSLLSSHPLPYYIHTYIYIIRPPNLGLKIAVPGREKVQGRSRGSTREALWEH